MRAVNVQPSRRVVLGGSAAAAIGGVFAGFGAGRATATASSSSAPQPTDAAHSPRFQPFHGKYQSGILSDPQAHAVFLGFNLPLDAMDRTESIEHIRSILKMLTADAQQLMSGRGVLADTEPEMSHAQSDLTVTVGVGQSILDVLGYKSSALGRLPEFKGEKLDARYGQSDLIIQCCAQDPTVLHHAVRALRKNLRGITELAFSQSGFMHAAQPVRPGPGFRNLFGQLDGINNPTGQARELAVFGDAQEPSWITGGTTLVLRRIEMNLDKWDEVDRAGRDFALGRRQSDGSPLSGTKSTDPVDLQALDASGLPAIAAHAHIARAKPETADEVLWRRGYNYHETQSSGLLFASYQREPARSFIPVQRRLAQVDALNEWITHVGSALYAILPGVAEGRYLGEEVFSQIKQ
ncbi:Dyp-type peroxidase [Glutamicibacter arilaitensis]|uniref:Dyp-type peroxidase n=1 Tax=Glutamicibacter arilaitensis TaxID=256701 RepID=UPI00384F3FE5